MIAHFVPFWGVNPYQRLLIHRLEEVGVEVRKWADMKEFSSLSGKLNPGSEVVHLHWIPYFGWTRLPQLLAYRRRLRGVRTSGAPVVWTAHNLVPHQSRCLAFDLLLTKQVVKAAEVVVCHSEAARLELKRYLGECVLHKSRVIPHGNFSDCYPNLVSRREAKAKFRVNEDNVVFLFIGQIRPYKGVFDLIAAFRKLNAEYARLLIAGRPYDQRTAESVRAAAAADPRIIAELRFIEDDELQLFLNASDVAVFPYASGLTSGALILAMSFGRACIASDATGTSECLGEHGGIVYDSSCPRALVSALNWAAANRADLARIGRNNYERSQRWDWRTIAESTRVAYVDAINMRS